MKGTLYRALYVDDNSMIGKPVAVEEVVEQFKKNWLVLKVSESARFCVMWHLVLKGKQQSMTRTALLIMSWEKKFGEKEMKIQSPKMPDIPKFSIVMPMDNNEKISVEDQNYFGLELWCCNILSSIWGMIVLDSANLTVFLEIYGVIKYVLTYVLITRSLGLKLEPTGSKKEP